MFTMKAARINVGLSIAEVAKALGISEATLYNYEQGKTSPTIALALAMAKLYGRSIGEIDFPMSTSSE